MPVAGGADGNKGKHYIFCKSCYFSVRSSIFAVRTKDGKLFCGIKNLTFSKGGCYNIFGHFLVTSVGFADKNKIKRTSSVASRDVKERDFRLLF
jgi:hypothetical protein